jgi:hypothetical protein
MNRDKLKQDVGITNEFIIASNHDYKCKCDLCLRWWLAVGPEYDEDNRPTFGPFKRITYIIHGGRFNNEMVNTAT